MSCLIDQWQEREAEVRQDKPQPITMTPEEILKREG